MSNKTIIMPCQATPQHTKFKSALLTQGSSAHSNYEFKSIIDGSPKIYSNTATVLYCNCASTSHFSTSVCC